VEERSRGDRWSARGFTANAEGFEPDGDFDATTDGDRRCDFCQGWRAASALQTDGSDRCNLSSFSSDLQQIVAAWETLPTAIRKAILALVGSIDLPETGKP
jgi:hypothetical protein